MYYAHIKNNEILDFSEAEYLNEDIQNIEVSEEIYNNSITYGKNYYIYSGNEIIQNPNYEEIQQQKERERINQLSLTKREVFLALYKDKGITPEQIKMQITNPQALIEFEYANDYFRGNPLIDVIGQTLGYTSEDLDYLFEHKELPV